MTCFSFIRFMSKQLELGVLELVLPESDLKLSLHATATFAYPNNSSHSLTHRPIEELDWDAVGKHWIQRGNGLSLKLRLQVDGVPIADSHLSRLEDLICHAEVFMNKNMTHGC
jgi:hypothetical protein